MADQDSPPAEQFAAALAHMNEDHADALLDYARGLAGIGWAKEARLIALDRLGMELEARGDAQGLTFRIPFPAPVADAAALRQTLIALVQQARARLGEDA
jgi:heme iron utilization protein